MDKLPIEQPDLRIDFIRSYRKVITIKYRLFLFYNIIIEQLDLSIDFIRSYRKVFIIITRIICLIIL